jgi:hypothetical protein
MSCSWSQWRGSLAVAEFILTSGNCWGCEFPLPSHCFEVWIVREVADGSCETVTKCNVLPARHTMVFNARQNEKPSDVNFNISDTRSSGILYILCPCIFVKLLIIFIIIIYLTAIGFQPGGSSTTIGHNRQVTHIQSNNTFKQNTIHKTQQ